MFWNESWRGTYPPWQEVQFFTQIQSYVIALLDFSVKFSPWWLVCFCWLLFLALWWSIWAVCGLHGTMGSQLWAVCACQVLWCCMWCSFHSVLSHQWPINDIGLFYPYTFPTHFIYPCPSTTTHGEAHLIQLSQSEPLGKKLFKMVGNFVAGFLYSGWYWM